MTAEAPPTLPRERLKRLGVWHFTDRMPIAEADEFAARLEELGFSTLWLPDTLGRDPFAHIAHLARSATRLVFATGIASIWNRHPGAMAQAANTLVEQTGGRFVLGLGVSHEPMVSGLRHLDYRRPLTRMREYLTAMDSGLYTAVLPPDPAPRLLAALGPRMLELARDAASGAHPYWTTPEHTAEARKILGADPLLCVEQKVVLTDQPASAREAAKSALAMYADLPNYRNNWKRLGFTDEEIDHREDRFVDAVVAWGDRETILRRIRDHYDAGADHVCVQPVPLDGGDAVDWRCLEALAPGS